MDSGNCTAKREQKWACISGLMLYVFITAVILRDRHVANVPLQTG